MAAKRLGVPSLELCPRGLLCFLQHPSRDYTYNYSVGRADQGQLEMGSRILVCGRAIVSEPPS